MPQEVQPQQGIPSLPNEECQRKSFLGIPFSPPLSTPSPGITARQVDVLVTNCSLFNPTPSLAAMVINSLGMRSDVDSYNLAGMGCSAGVLAVGLASKLLKVGSGFWCGEERGELHAHPDG